MDLLKRLFGGGGGGNTATSSGDPNGIYFYVQPDGCDEVVRVRVDRNNEPSLGDDGSTYHVHKSVRGSKCRQSADLYLYFDAGRRLQNSQVEHGALVDHAAYEAWISGQGSS